MEVNGLGTSGRRQDEKSKDDGLQFIIERDEDPNYFLQECFIEGQTIQIAMQPFISRFLCVRALTLGCPLFRDDGGGNLRVLNVTKTFWKTR